MEEENAINNDDDSLQKCIEPMKKIVDKTLCLMIKFSSESIIQQRKHSCRKQIAPPQTIEIVPPNMFQLFSHTFTHLLHQITNASILANPLQPTMSLNSPPRHPDHPHFLLLFPLSIKIQPVLHSPCLQ